MLTILSAAAMIAFGVGASLLLLYILRQRWPVERMRRTNDATVFYITVTGTIYAVILAFMLSSVWDEFQRAKVNAEQEANGLVNIFRLADAFPDGQRQQIQDLARSYARTMVQDEWPAMEREELSQSGVDCVEQLWRGLTQVEADTRPAEQAALQQALAELSKMTEHRRVRQLQSRFQLPVILWLVLLFGAVATVANSCLLGVENVRLHVLYIVTLSCLVALVLVAIAEINRPFQGFIRVDPRAFEMALATFDRSVNH